MVGLIPPAGKTALSVSSSSGVQFLGYSPPLCLWALRPSFIRICVNCRDIGGRSLQSSWDIPLPVLFPVSPPRSGGRGQGLSERSHSLGKSVSLLRGLLYPFAIRVVGLFPLTGTIPCCAGTRKSHA